MMPPSAGTFYKNSNKLIWAGKGHQATELHTPAAVPAPAAAAGVLCIVYGYLPCATGWTKYSKNYSNV